MLLIHFITGHRSNQTINNSIQSTKETVEIQILEKIRERLKKLNFFKEMTIKICILLELGKPQKFER